MTYALMSEGLVTVLLFFIPGSQSSQIGILCSVEVMLVRIVDFCVIEDLGGSFDVVCVCVDNEGLSSWNRVTTMS